MSTALTRWFETRFKASRAKEIMQEVLKTKLAGTAYHADNTSTWAREISDEIKSKLKGKLHRITS